MRRVLLPVFVFIAVFALALAPAFAQCTVSQNCSGGGSVQCTGNSSCQRLSNSVECDGLAVTCSGLAGGCAAQYNCPVPPFSNYFILFCSGASSCSTNVFGNSITCDGTTFTCSYCEAHPNECDSFGF